MAVERTALTHRDYAALPDDGQRYQSPPGGFRLAARVQGAAPVAVPPFERRPPVPDWPWPPASAS
jgi:hypothetical protein